MWKITTFTSLWLAVHVCICCVNSCVAIVSSVNANLGNSALDLESRQVHDARQQASQREHDKMDGFPGEPEANKFSSYAGYLFLSMLKHM